MLLVHGRFAIFLKNDDDDDDDIIVLMTMIVMIMLLQRIKSENKCSALFHNQLKKLRNQENCSVFN